MSEDNPEGAEKTKASELAEELARRSTKLDRPDRQLQFDLYDTIQALTNVNLSAYVVIKDSAEILKEESLSAEQAVTNYKAVRKSRHNLWYELIYSNLLPIWSHNGHESKFSQFFAKFRSETHTNDRDLIGSSADFDEKTPDIMLYNKLDKTVVIGDITVTSNVTYARNRKYEKYAPIVKFLEDNNYVTMHVDFILCETLSNVDTQMARLITDRIVPATLDYREAKDYTQNATRLMDMIREMCVSQHQFAIVMEKSDNLTQDKSYYSLMEGIIDDSVKDMDLPTYDPRLSEDEIIKMVKNKVDQVGGAQYFDYTIADVNKEFDNIIKANKDRTKMPPKSVLKVVDNSFDYSQFNDLELIESYLTDIASSDDCDERNYILNLLPTWPQLKQMKYIKENNLTRDQIQVDPDSKDCKVGGKYQYMRANQLPNYITNKMEISLTMGKVNKNEKKEPRVVDLEDAQNFISHTDVSMRYYGSLSSKPPELDGSWDAKNKLEFDNTKCDREVYDYCRRTNGVQLANSLSGLYERINHLSAKSGSYDNVYVPPNGSFIAFMPKEHAPVDRRTCDMPMVFITRAVLGRPLDHIDYEYRLCTRNYIYYVSKLCRLNVTKISCWQNAGHRLTASCSYIMTKCKKLFQSKEMVVGLYTYLTLDVHQKISLYLDLLKYISFMPFADLHLLPLLVKDKCDLMMKTRFDVWMFYRIRSYINELSLVEKLDAKKPVMQIQNGVVVPKSLGIELKLPSFIDLTIRHDDATEFIEEIGQIFTLRPKHLYGSQFLDESSTMTAQWNLDYDEEISKYGGWATVGDGEGTYPFESKFCYSADAIYYATSKFHDNINATRHQIERHLFNGAYGDFMHTNCSLRGCTKEKGERTNQDDMHTTSIDACLKYYKTIDFDNVKCRALYIGQEFALSDKIMEFSMSEKDQRGGGRPIATPTLGTKAALMLIEKPEAAIGKFVKNNILVAGKNKLSEQHETYTSTISHGVSLGLNQVYQLTEDQTKYSENDNPRKYEIYLRSSRIISPEIRRLQYVSLQKLYDRHHLLHRFPTVVTESDDLFKETYTDASTKAIKARIGWPQGMLNNLSTSVHSAADYWIAYAFKKAYPGIRIYVKGLVHSDDSWAVVCCDNIETFKLYTTFRLFAKKMFCLKLNEKKLWGGRHLGELVSNYNLNGNVHLQTGKVITNGLSNLTYHNWPIDVSNQISTLQQAMRAGATMGNLIMLNTILRQQIMGSYHVTGLQKQYIFDLPIELGGYPNCSAFKLGVCGVNAVTDELGNKYSRSAIDGAYRIVLGATATTRECIADRLRNEGRYNRLDEDFVEIVLPTKSELFKGVKYMMPKSRKVKNALQTVYEVTDMFPSDKLGMIITHPKTIEESLGHLRDNIQSSLYQLASERFTQNMRNLAVSQAQQSSGKVVKLYTGSIMTINEMLEYLTRKAFLDCDKAMIKIALEPESEVVMACSTIVDSAKVVPDTRHHRGHVINRMPEIDSLFDTISPIQDVLLSIIDMSERTPEKDSLYNKYGSRKTCIETLTTDCNNIKDRFNKFFLFYEVRQACNMIMQNKLNAIKERSWVQPKIYHRTLCEFLEGLYGVTLNRDIKYMVSAGREYLKGKGRCADLIKTIYSTEILNRVYDGHFEMESIQSMSVKEALQQVDQTKLTRNDLLKLAVTNLVLYDNRDLIDSIYQSDQFVYKWIKTQDFNSRRRYCGDWVIIFKIGSLVCRATSTSGKIWLEINQMNLFLLLKGMRLVAERCFGKKYEYDSAWHLCPLWKPLGTPFRSDYYLKHWGHFDTEFTNVREEGSISVSLIETLKIGFVIDDRRPDDYMVDVTLRVISAVFSNPGRKDEVYRVGSIFQDIDMPLRTAVKLKYSHIHGFQNSILYYCGIMEDLLQSKPLGLSKSELFGVIKTAGGIDRVNPTWKALYQLSSRVKGRVLPVYEDMGLYQEQPEIVDIQLDFIGTQSMCEFSMNSKVETMEAVNIEFGHSVMKGQFKVRKVNDIMRALCMEYWGSITDRNKDDFVCRFMTNPTIDKALQRWDLEMLNDAYEEIYEDEMWLECDLELFTFIVGTELDQNSYWRSFNKKSIDKWRDTPARFYRETALLDKMVEFTTDALSLDKIEQPRTALDMIK